MPTYKSTGNQMFKLKRKSQTNRRDGISIIEVLTSMAVATIGVFGVMVMIPFAVKQSQTGLDNDAASALGRNAIETLQVDGFLTVNETPIFAAMNEILPGMLFEPDPLNTSLGLFNYNLTRIGEEITFGGSTFNFPGMIHFDPIGFADPDGPANPMVGMTEFTIDPGGDAIKIFSANAARTAGVDVNGNGSIDAGEPIAGGSITIREASRLCRSRDEMFYEVDNENLEPLAPPQPLFDVDSSSGDFAKRQFSGRISWSAFLVPEKHPSLTTAPVSRFRSHVAVYRDRFISPTDPIGSNYGIYLTNMAAAPGADGYTQAVSQITFGPGDGVNTEEVVRGSWIMLVNRIPEAEAVTIFSPIRTISGFDYSVAREGYRLQTMFAKVIRVSGDGSIVTIEGGPFDFVPPGLPGPTGSMNLPSSQTYMVHLKNVVNVYERSISVDR